MLFTARCIVIYSRARVSVEGKNDINLNKYISSRRESNKKSHARRQLLEMIDDGDEVFKQKSSLTSSQRLEEALTPSSEVENGIGENDVFRQGVLCKGVFQSLEDSNETSTGSCNGGSSYIGESSYVPLSRFDLNMGEMSTDSSSSQNDQLDIDAWTFSTEGSSFLCTMQYNQQHGHHARKLSCPDIPTTILNNFSCPKVLMNEKKNLPGHSHGSGLKITQTQTFNDNPINFAEINKPTSLHKEREMANEKLLLYKAKIQVSSPLPPIKRVTTAEAQGPPPLVTVVSSATSPCTDIFTPRETRNSVYEKLEQAKMSLKIAKQNLEMQQKAHEIAINSLMNQLSESQHKFSALQFECHQAAKDFRKRQQQNDHDWRNKIALSEAKRQVLQSQALSLQKECSTAKERVAYLEHNFQSLSLDREQFKTKELHCAEALLVSKEQQKKNQVYIELLEQKLQNALETCSTTQEQEADLRSDFDVVCGVLVKLITRLKTICKEPNAGKISKIIQNILNPALQEALNSMSWDDSFQGLIIATSKELNDQELDVTSTEEFDDIGTQTSMGESRYATADLDEKLQAENKQLKVTLSKAEEFLKDLDRKFSQLEASTKTKIQEQEAQIENLKACLVEIQAVNLGNVQEESITSVNVRELGDENDKLIHTLDITKQKNKGQEIKLNQLQESHHQDMSDHMDLLAENTRLQQLLKTSEEKFQEAEDLRSTQQQTIKSLEKENAKCAFSIESVDLESDQLRNKLMLAEKIHSPFDKSTQNLFESDCILIKEKKKLEDDFRFVTEVSEIASQKCKQGQEEIEALKSVIMKLMQQNMILENLVIRRDEIRKRSSDPCSPLHQEVDFEEKHSLHSQTENEFEPKIMEATGQNIYSHNLRQFYSKISREKIFSEEIDTHAEIVKGRAIISLSSMPVIDKQAREDSHQASHLKTCPDVSQEDPLVPVPSTPSFATLSTSKAMENRVASLEKQVTAQRATIDLLRSSKLNSPSKKKSPKDSKSGCKISKMSKSMNSSISADPSKAIEIKLRETWHDSRKSISQYFSAKSEAYDVKDNHVSNEFNWPIDNSRSKVDDTVNILLARLKARQDSYDITFLREQKDNSIKSVCAASYPEVANLNSNPNTSAKRLMREKVSKPKAQSDDESDVFTSLGSLTTHTSSSTSHTREARNNLRAHRSDQNHPVSHFYFSNSCHPDPQPAVGFSTAESSSIEDTDEFVRGILDLLK